MADVYLNIAERVMAEVREPLRPRQIVRHAYAMQLIPHHLYGRRQDKTLHARLSEDIAANPERSRFYRTAPGVFFLQQLRADPTIPELYKPRYLAPPRRKELKKEAILHLDLDAQELLRPDGYTIPVSRIIDALHQGRYAFRPADSANDRLTALHSFVVVHRDKDVLSFRCGKFYPNTDPLYGKRSIGIGGAVFASDVDMLYNSLFGIVGNGVNELIYGIGLSNRAAEDARYKGLLRPKLGVLIREDAFRVLHFVMSYKCPIGFYPSKSALSINDLRWINAVNLANSLDDFDRTSEILFSQDYVRDIIGFRW